MTVEDHGVPRTTRKRRNKPETEPEATKNKTRSKTATIINPELRKKLKKTSPRKVKTPSKLRRQPLTQNSPKSPSLKRLQARSLPKIAPRSSLLTEKPDNSPRKSVNFKK